MILRSVHLVNFRLHADSMIHFAPNGVSGLAGSNEAGKSTVIEGVCWGLFGADALRGSKDSLRWKRATARRQAEVTVVFEVGGKQYEINRTESDATLFEGPGRTRVAAGTTAVNKYVPATVLGMSYEEFSSSYLCKQRDLNRLQLLRGTPRRQFMLSVLGIGKIDEAIDEARAIKNALKSEVSGLSAGLGERAPLEAEQSAAAVAIAQATADLATARELQAQAKQAAENAAGQLAASEQLAKRYAEAQQQVTAATQAAEAALREFQRVTAQLTALAAAQARVDAAAPYLAPLPMLIEELTELPRAQLLAGQRADLTAQRDRAEREAKHAAEVIADAQRQAAFYIGDDALARITDELEAAGKELDKLRVERTIAISKAQTELAAAQADAKKNARARDLMRAEGENGSCPVCTRRLAEHYQMVLTEITRAGHEIAERADSIGLRLIGLKHRSEREVELMVALEDLVPRGTDAQQKRADAELARKCIARETPFLTDRTNEQKRLEEKLLELPAVAFDDEALAYVQGEVKRLQELAKQIEPDRVKVAQRDQLHAELAERDATRLSTARHVEKCTNAMLDVGFDEAAHHKLWVHEQNASLKSWSTQQEAARAEEKLTAATSRNDRAVLALSQYDSRAEALTALKADLRNHERTAEMLAEFRTAAAGKIRPEMEALVSGFVNLLTEGRHEAVTISDDFEVTAFESGVATEVVSGGTEDVIALSMRLAVSQMIAERAGHPLSLLVLDEVFTSFDETRRAGAMAMIRRLGSVFSQVLLISHIPDMRDSVDFCIELQYDEGAGCSRVVAAPVKETRSAEVAA